MAYVLDLTYILYLKYNRSEPSPSPLSSQLLWNYPDHLKPTAYFPESKVGYDEYQTITRPSDH